MKRRALPPSGFVVKPVTYLEIARQVASNLETGRKIASKRGGPARAAAPRSVGLRAAWSGAVVRHGAVVPRSVGLRAAWSGAVVRHGAMVQYGAVVRHGCGGLSAGESTALGAAGASAMSLIRPHVELHVFSAGPRQRTRAIPRPGWARRRGVCRS
jgi:hypothetical protein